MARSPAQGATGPVAAPGLELRNIHVAYDGRAVLDEVSLSVAGGTVTAVLGQSGVGKSTLLRRIVGLLQGAGTIHADDGDPVAPRAVLMAQTDLLLPWLKVADNAALGAKLRGQQVDQGRLSRLLNDVGLSDASEQRPASLSGGMRQRAALARTLMEDRPIVLMDEPFSAVDALTRIRLQDLSARLLAGRTVLLVTHDPWEAIRIADRVIVLAGVPATVALDVSLPGPAPRAPDSEGAQQIWRDLMNALASENEAA